MATLTALVGGMAAACLVLLLWRPSPLARLRAGPSGRGWRLPQRLRARPDALPARVRALAGVGAGVGVYAWAGPLAAYVAVPMAGLAGIATAVGLGLLEPRSAVRRRESLLAGLPQALRLIAACLAAGLPLRRAVEAVSQATGGVVGEQFDKVLAQIGVGVGEPEAWLSLSDDPVLGALARDLARAVESGTGVQAALVHRAEELQSDHRAACETRAKAVGVRTVLPLTLCFLPAFFLLGVVPVVAGLLLPVLAPWLHP